MIKVIGGILAICLLCSCSDDAGKTDDQVTGVVLPHHNLVGKYIDEIYSEIDKGNVDRIIVISTNHFDSGYHYIQSAYELNSDLELQTSLIEKLDNENIISVEETGVNAEHGITVHTERIERYFPEVQVVPLIIKWETPQKRLDDLVEVILADGDMDRTLVVASIDFSHFVDEETAAANDERTMAWFKDWENGKEISLDEIWDLEKSIKMDTEVATALDSPETLYVFAKLMGDVDKVEIVRRTSSHSMYGGTEPMENTSHLFVKVR